MAESPPGLKSQLNSIRHRSLPGKLSDSFLLMASPLADTKPTEGGGQRAAGTRLAVLAVGYTQTYRQTKAFAGFNEDLKRRRQTATESVIKIGLHGGFKQDAFETGSFLLKRGQDCKLNMQSNKKLINDSFFS